MERARCMRLHVGFPLQFWVDTVDTNVYLINRGSSSSLDGGIPEEAWTGKRSRDVIFNEKVLYKNQLQEKTQEKENKEYTVLDEITEKVKVPENNNNQQPQQQQPPQHQHAPQTPESEAMQVESRKKWEVAMEEEMDSLMHNQTWDLVKLPAGKTTLKNKWVYKLKEEDGGKQRYKARLVVKWFA
eukprot:PITA_32731